MSDKVIITAALTGSRPTKADNPAVPYSPQEIAQAALDCWRAGAAIAHIHVRDPHTGAPVSQLALFQEVLERVRAQSDMLVNLTTSGLHLQGDPEDLMAKRLEVVALHPDLCSLDVGSLNFSDRVFLNPPDWGVTAAKRMQEAGVKAEIEVFELGHISQALELIERGLIAEPPFFQLCMGVKWGIPATLENLLFMKAKLPPNACWSVLGVGRSQLPMIAAAILQGGNIRVGFEDNLYLRKGVLAQSNAQLVEMAVDLVHALQREVAAPEQARGILGI
jgi:3-keto-5-aminohexanoate cleavage enzyme